MANIGRTDVQGLSDIFRAKRSLSDPAHLIESQFRCSASLACAGPIPSKHVGNIVFGGTGSQMIRTNADGTVAGVKNKQRFIKISPMNTVGDTMDAMGHFTHPNNAVPALDPASPVPASIFGRVTRHVPPKRLLQSKARRSKKSSPSKRIAVASPSLVVGRTPPSGKNRIGPTDFTSHRSRVQEER